MILAGALLAGLIGMALVVLAITNLIALNNEYKEQK